MRPPPFAWALKPEEVNSLKEHARILLEQLDYWYPYSNHEVLREDGKGRFEKILAAVRANIVARDQLIELLHQQIGLLARDRTGLQDHEEMLLPGQIVQNETRVDWEALRKQFGIVLDKPVGFYQQQIKDMLEKPLGLAANTEMSYATAIGLCPEDNEGTIFPLDQMQSIEHLLHQRGLCRCLPLRVLLRKFYWPWFCQIRLEDLPLSGRLFNCLKWAGLNILGELILQPQQKLLGIRLFGNTRMEELLRLLYAMGLKLEMTEADFRRLYGV